MVSGKGIEQNKVGCCAEAVHDCVVTAWDWVFGWSSNLVELDVVDAESPDIVFDVVDVLLMWLWR